MSAMQTTPKNTKRNLSGRLPHRLNVSNRDSLSDQSRNRAVSRLYYNSDKQRNIVNRSIIDFKEFERIPERIVETENDNEIICETPKLKYDPFHGEIRPTQDDFIAEIDFKDTNPYVNTKPLCDTKKNVCRSKSENEILQGGIININPYVNYENIYLKPLKEKENVCESSFFTPELLRTKPASTPLNENFRKTPLLDISNINSIRKRRNSISKSRIPRRPTTPYITKKPLIEKSRKDRETKKKAPIILSRTAPVIKNISPNRSSHVRRSPSTFNKDCMSVSYKSLINSSSDVSFGTLKRVLKRVHKYGTATAKWTMSMFSVCTKLGNSLKLGIAHLCASCEDNVEPNKICLCSQYRDELNELKSKINNLSLSFNDLKSQLIENIQNNRKIDDLNANLEEMSKELSSLKMLKAEMNCLREQLQTANRTQTYAFPPKSAPPPPPPPPPLLPAAGHSSINKTSGRTKTVSTKSNATPRPTISLDDILKVKLKKTSERVPSRRSSGNQPEVTTEMLKQVKLRKPTSKSMTPSSFPELSSEGSTSPHSSLKKLLRDDGGFRIKRLRRVGGYSFDDIHKKSLLRTNRERD